MRLSTTCSRNTTIQNTDLANFGSIGWPCCLTLKLLPAICSENGINEGALVHAVGPQFFLLINHQVTSSFRTSPFPAFSNLPLQAALLSWVLYMLACSNNQLAPPIYYYFCFLFYYYITLVRKTHISKVQCDGWVNLSFSFLLWRNIVAWIASNY